MKLLRFVICLLAVMGMSSAWAVPAKPDVKKEPGKELSARPIFNPDGSFGFCLTEQNYPNGRKLTVALNPTDESWLRCTKW